ncbi:MAG: hypothetical protein CMF96_10155 [Candidatus Marinimicrobia bacterium]|nr:hypothetical protein [Candidatus Neomarinimicrobiota bacterium]|tara:strand:+ start:366 stop:2066 length:1701 start_codon:yes stop_codon:yes gene_type:complete
MVKTLSILIILFTFGVAKEHVVSINGTNYGENEFFEFYPKSEWERINSNQKERILNDFIRKKVAVIDAKEKNFLNNPKTAIKLRNRSDFLYVNKTYEKLVALPLVPKKYIESGKKHILRDLNISHILIGFIGSEMPGDFTLSEQEAYEEASEVLSLTSSFTDFKELAIDKSDDPNVVNNKGNLGWVSWGKIDPEFQEKVYQLSKGDFSNPIKTKYGYHIVYVLDERVSEAANYPKEKLVERVEYSSLGLVKSKLKNAADNYDKNLLSVIGFSLNESAMVDLGKVLSEHQEKMTYMNNVDIIPVLEGYDKKNNIVFFNNKGFGVKWLINKISKSSPSRRPSIDSVESLKLAIRTLVLQLLAVEKGKKNNLDSSYGFQSQYSGIEEEILYDAYVKYLVNSAPEPSEEDLKSYYKEFKETKYKEPEKYSVYNLKVKTQALADSLHREIKSGSDFFVLSKKFSLLSPKNAGKMHLFDKSKNKDIIEAIKNINPGDISNVFNSRDKKWSIVYFEELVPANILPFDKVKNRIKTALNKQNQDLHKENSFSNLNKKYKVTKNDKFFKPEEQIK